MQGFAHRRLVTALRLSHQRHFSQTAAFRPCKQRYLLIASGATAAGIVGGISVANCSQANQVEAPSKQLFLDLAKELSDLEKDSETWKKEKEKKVGCCSIVISSAPTHIPEIRGRRYRIEMRSSPNQSSTLTPERIADEMQDMPKRMKWDPNLYHGEFLHFTSQFEPDVVCFRSHAAAGGVISSREFVDARMCIRQDNEIVVVGKHWHTEAGTSPAKGLTQAANSPGVRAHIRREADGTVCITMFQHTELGGSIPIWLLNATVADAHMKYASSLLVALGLA